MGHAATIIALLNAEFKLLLGTAFNVEVLLGSLLLGPLGGTIASGLGLNFAAEVLTLMAELDTLLAEGIQPFGALLAAALSAAWRVPEVSWLIPQIQGMVIENQLRGGAKANGLRGKHWVVTTGSR